MHLDYSVKKYICQELGKWLNGFEWTWYATLTFRFEVKDPINAKKYFIKWIRLIKNDIVDDICYFVAVERFRGNFGTHLHSLIWVGHQEDGKNRLILPYWSIWFEKYGRAKIELYDKNKGAGYYLSKYVTKEICDYDVSEKLKKMIKGLDKS